MENFKECKVEGCEGNAHWTKKGARGCCLKHYRQLCIYGKIIDEEIKKRREEMINKKCKVEGCNNSSYYKSGGKCGYCGKHQCQFYKHGKILERTLYDINEIIDCGDYYEICLYKGKGEQKEVARTKIDKEDLNKVKNYKWGFDGNGYAKMWINKKTFRLHQLIMGKKEGYEVDHINHDTLDNRKQNLRFTTGLENCHNKKVKGYSWDKKNNKWRVDIGVNGKHINLGRFNNKQNAINIRRNAEKKYFGDFAYNYNN